MPLMHWLFFLSRTLLVATNKRHALFPAWKREKKNIGKTKETVHERKTSPVQGAHLKAHSVAVQRTACLHSEQHSEQHREQHSEQQNYI